jgi:hypothetical protein
VSRCSREDHTVADLAPETRLTLPSSGTRIRETPEPGEVISFGDKTAWLNEGPEVNKCSLLGL